MSLTLQSVPPARGRRMRSGLLLRAGRACRHAVAVIALALCAASASGQGLLVRMGTLNLVVPSSWLFSGANQRVVGRGPDGEALIANYRVLKPDAPPQSVEEHWRFIRGFATERMPALAAKSGEVLRPVTETTLPGGRVQFSSVSQANRDSHDYYFLQYLLGSTRMMLFVTVEGNGSARDAADRFESILATQRWDE